jgi:hypothetical protein
LFVLVSSFLALVANFCDFNLLDLTCATDVQDSGWTEINLRLGTFFRLHICSVFSFMRLFSATPCGSSHPVRSYIRATKHIRKSIHRQPDYSLGLFAIWKALHERCDCFQSFGRLAWSQTYCICHRLVLAIGFRLSPIHHILCTDSLFCFPFGNFYRSIVSACRYLTVVFVFASLSCLLP